MSETRTAEVEIEGGGWSWFYICGDCHGAVEYKAEKCGCGAKLDWKGVLMEHHRRYRGEQTEPAE